MWYLSLTFCSLSLVPSMLLQMEIFLYFREFPGSPMADTQCLYCQGLGSILVRELKCHKLHSAAKKKSKDFMLE